MSGALRLQSSRRSAIFRHVAVVCRECVESRLGVPYSCRDEPGNGAGKRCKWLILKLIKPRSLVCQPLVICSNQIADSRHQNFTCQFSGLRIKVPPGTASAADGGDHRVKYRLPLSSLLGRHIHVPLMVESWSKRGNRPLSGVHCPTRDTR